MSHKTTHSGSAAAVGGYTADYRPISKRAYHYRAKSALIRANRDVCTCEACESTHRPEIHHRDADYRHNEADNLQVLCRECHLSIHGR